ncbi:MAG: serine hydrolase, partial [Cyanobacteria bacterium J06607_15]
QPKTAVKSQNKAKLNSLLAIATLGKEITPLKISLEKLTEQYPDLDPEVFLVDLDTKGFVSLNGKQAIASASTIKLPILVAFLQDVDRGTVRLEEKLVITKDVIAGGSGNMQHEALGTRFSALETATRMMTISDNTATNMLIKRLGGMKQLNERFGKMGLNTTQLSNLLPDLTGTNTTSSADLGNLLVKIDGGKLISLRSRDRLLYIMRQVVKDTLLPQGLESEAIIAHKTGDIKSVLADVGIIDMPSGKRYIASILVKRPDNSPQAQEFIQKASRTAYQYFKTPQTTSFTLKDES